MPNNLHQQAVYLVSGLPQTENRPADNYSGGQLGSRFTVLDPQDSNKAKGYQLVKNDSAMDVNPAANSVAWWRDATGYTVTTDSSFAGRGNVAGVYLMSVTLGYICCIQQKGPCPVAFTTGTPLATGLFAVPSATDGTADAIAAGSPATYPPLGVTVSVATANVATVELDLPGRE